MGKFAINFGLSFLVYLVAIFLVFPIVLILRFINVDPFSIWQDIALWLHVLISATLFFFLGTRLNLLDNHLLDFLSACGGLAFGLYMMLLGSYALILPQFSFGVIAALIVENTNYNLYLAITVVSILPALITWLGMVYKSRQA